jgi:hypothetical protein
MIAMPHLAIAAGAPTTGPATAQLWLDRAQREIAALPVGDTSPDVVLVQPQLLSMYLYRMAPSNPRQALAIHLIDQDLQIEVDKKTSVVQVQAAYVGAAQLHAEVDDLDGARRLLALSKDPVDAPVADPSVQAIINAGINQYQADIALRLGNDAGFEQIDLPAIPAMFVAKNFRWEGLNALADKADDWAIKKYLAASTQPAAPADPKMVPLPFFGDTGPELVVDAIQAEVDTGNFAAASQMAAKAEDNLPSTSLFSEGYLRCQAYRVIARAAVKAGDLAQYADARDAFIAVATKYPGDRQSEFQNFLGISIRADDKTGFAAIASLWKSAITDKASSPTLRLEYAQETSQIAGLYGEFGDRDNCQSLIDEAEKVLATAMQQPNPDTATHDAGRIAEDYLWIAAARARVGDTTGVATDEAASIKAARVDPMLLEDARLNIVWAYADTGHFEQALAEAAKDTADDSKFLLRDISRRQSNAGKFDDAWQTIAPMPMRTRMLAEYYIIVEQTRTGQTTGLAERIDAMPNPNERALANLAAAGALMGNPYAGALRMYKPTEE